MFEEPFSDVYEENGIFFYRGLPIINYKQLNIPEKIETGIEEIKYTYSDNTKKWLYNTEGSLRYSINPISGNVCGDSFDDKYLEIYSCVLDFDEETLMGTAVGFEVLGKITPLSNKLSVEALYKYLIHDSGHRSTWEAHYEESYKRSLEYGFLNLFLETDDEGNKQYKYTSIWDDVDNLIALNAKEFEDEEVEKVELSDNENAITISEETKKKLVERRLDNMTYDEALNKMIEACHDLAEGVELLQNKVRDLKGKNKKLKCGIIGCAVIIGAQALALIRKYKK